MEIEKKVWLTFGPSLVERPLLCTLAKQFDIMFDIRQASVHKDVGIVAMLVRGEEDEIQAALDFLSEQGVQVEPIEKSVVE